LPYRLADQRINEFERIFHPRSIAVVGVSRDNRKMGSLWAKALMESGFRGPVYAVNPGGGEFLGARIHTSVRAIPGEVDLVISCIPRAFVLDLLDDCAAKRVAAVHFYTAGFRETGEEQWVRVEEEMVRRARKGGFRIIGPNCIGVCCPEHELPYGASTLVGRPGPVGFISQSGGHAGKVMVVGLTRGIGFSKVASVGNCCDLGCADFLEYMAVDPGTGVVGLYLEGPRDTRRLLQVMRATAERKPVVVWKGGATEAGAKAASSHTGAIRTSAAAWTGALKQAGAIEVRGVDEMADTLLLLQRVRSVGRASLGVICGLTGDGQSEALLADDACRPFGIEVFPFSESGGLAGPAGVLRASERSISLAAADGRVDIILVYENMDLLVGLTNRGTADAINGMILQASQKSGKPVMVVSPPGCLELDRLEIEYRLSGAGVPVFVSMERAARAVADVRQHCRRIGS
jgi:acyl-CoA synthetase (NDP forming)